MGCPGPRTRAQPLRRPPHAFDGQHVHSAQRTEQLLAANRLDKVFAGPGRQSAGPLVHDRGDDHREPLSLGISPQLLQYFPAVHAGKQDVQHRGHRLEAMNSIEALLPVAGPDDPYPMTSEISAHQVEGRAVVVDHYDDRIPVVVEAGADRYAGALQGDGEAERAADPDLAL